jgi:hypothetical protein
MRRWIFVVLTLVIAAVLVVPTVQARLRSHYTCALCRLDREDNAWQLFGTTSTFRENACSRWYPQHVEADHEHVWARGASVGIVNYFGQTIGVGDNFDRPGRLIWRLTHEEQIAVYQHFPDPEDAQDVFHTLLDPVVVESDQDRLLFDELKAWIESGFAGDFHNPL